MALHGVHYLSIKMLLQVTLHTVAGDRVGRITYIEMQAKK